MIKTQINEFEMFNWFEITKKTLKTVLIIFMRTCKTVSIKPYTNREDGSEISQFSYTDIVVTITMKFLEVLTPPSIYRIEAHDRDHPTVNDDKSSGGGRTLTPDSTEDVLVSVGITLNFIDSCL